MISAEKRGYEGPRDGGRFVDGGDGHPVPAHGPAWWANYDGADPIDARTCATLLHLAVERHPTVGSVAEAAGDRSHASTSLRLHGLRRDGWVRFEEGRKMTLRAGFGFVRFQARKGDV